MSPHPESGPLGRSTADRPGDPEAVERFAGILADWLASYTIPGPLAAEMADALEAGSAWVGAIGAGAVRRAGWPDTEAVAWGIAVSALAAAHEAAALSLEGEAVAREPGSGALGPAVALLAADGLIAAAHETLASLAPERLVAAFAALERVYGDGGPWRLLPAEAGRSSSGRAPAWPRFMPLALYPAAMARPEGPWADLAVAWELSGSDDDGTDPEAAGRARHDHPAADGSTGALLRAAAIAAGRPPRVSTREPA
jgi:hypothetical protein